MRTTIDAAGRLVVPKPLRDALGLSPGQPLDLQVRDGRLEIEPASTPMRLAGQGSDVFAETDEDVGALTADDVRAALEQTRR